ncbi:MAG: UDP-N-acetylmuramoyl-L-alanyl-D-glutamate--2,6-diaminopimelate ligase [Vicinamibacterales bacterium]
MKVRDLLSSVAPRLSPQGVVVSPSEGRGLDQLCAGVTSDSRKVVANGVFVALQGRAFDGLQFVDDALAAGAVAVVSERPATVAGVVWMQVPDARRALALLADAFFGHPSQHLRVVGITGTNGKTTTSYLVRAILEASGVSCGLMGTIGHNVGGRDVPATRTTQEATDVQAMMRDMVDAGSAACVMEVTSHALALHRVDGIRFEVAVFTNLTRDHLDFHGDMESYFGAKRRLFEMLPAEAPGVVNIDDPRGAALAGTTARTITYGINRPADVSPGPLSFTVDGLTFDARTPAGVVHVRSRLVGRVNVYNILAAIGTALALDVPIAAIERGLAGLAGVPGRFEVVSEPRDGIAVIVDYAHTDDALRNLLETARSLAPRRLVTVFGAGGERDRTKRPLMGMVAARLSDLVVITSDNPRNEDPERIIDEVRLGADPETKRGVQLETIVDRADAISFAIRQAASGDIVLIAGKGHEKSQEIAGRQLPFDDVAVARGALEARRVKARVG